VLQVAVLIAEWGVYQLYPRQEETAPILGTGPNGQWWVSYIWLFIASFR